MSELVSRLWHQKKVPCLEIIRTEGEQKFVTTLDLETSSLAELKLADYN